MRLFTILFRQGLQCQLKPPISKKGGFLRGAFGKYLLLTNTVSSGVLMGIGDYCQQRIEMHQTKPNNKPYDAQRTVNMSIVALGHGVFHHFFYGWMDKKYPVNSLRNIWHKILLDQTIASPVCMWIFFIGMAIVEGRGYESGWQELKNKFLFCYLVDWAVWPPNQFINFYFIPPQFRVVYINALTMIYDVFLSYIKFYDQIEEDQVTAK